MPTSREQMGTKSGDTCQSAGTYRFDGYVDGSMSPSPKGEEVQVMLKAGDQFPIIASCQKPCWWRRRK